MKILHILNHSMKGNGHVNVAVDLACEQAAQGHQVGMIAGVSHYQEVMRKAGVEYFDVPFNYKRPLALWRTVRRSAAALDKFQPDVVHSHMAASTVIARWLQGRRGYGLVSTVHNSFDRQAVLMGRADLVVCVSDAVRDLMAERGINAKKLVVVRNGTVGSARRPLPCPAPADFQHPAIVTVAGLDERKGVQDLIQAFNLVAATHPSVHLYIAGNGPMLAALQAQAAASPAANRIQFLGFRDDPRDVLGGADIFALASHADPFPLVILEALEAACPIVASQVDGIPEALDFGRAGVLVPPKDPPAWAAALSGLLADPGRLAAARVTAKERAKVYSVAKMVAGYKEVYEQVRSSRTHVADK